MIEIKLTNKQIRYMNRIIDAYDPCFIDIEDTNRTGVVVMRFSRDSSKHITEVLVDAEGNEYTL